MQKTDSAHSAVAMAAPAENTAAAPATAAAPGEYCDKFRGGREERECRDWRDQNFCYRFRGEEQRDCLRWRDRDDRGRGRGDGRADGPPCWEYRRSELPP